MNVRPLAAADRSTLEALLRNTSEFRPDEVDVALELIDASLVDAVGSGYFTSVAVDADQQLVGYVCFGPTPMTAHTWDLYWLAVGPTARGLGAGRALVQACDAAVAVAGGRIIRIETSSQDAYDGTLAFYQRVGFVDAGRIPDFYAPGDDLVIMYRGVAHT